MTGRSFALVLLPGLDGTGRLFRPLLDNLPEWIEPIVVSYPTDTAYGYQELKTIVSSALPTDTDFIVLGESFSGPLAVMIAAEKPDRLKGIILCASFIKKPFKLLPAWLSHLSIGPIYQLWPATIRLRALFASAQFSALAEQALDAIRSVRPTVIAARVKAILHVDVAQALSQARVPLLYLAGRKDHLIRKHNVTAIKQLRPDMRLVEMDTQHFVLQMAPARSAEAIERFIESISQPATIRQSTV